MPNWLEGKTYAANIEAVQMKLGGVSISANFGAGDEYFLDPTNGSDSNDGKTPATAFASLLVAYAALTADQNDVLYHIGGATGATLDAEVLDWSKSYTHYIGLCAPTHAGQRARIYHEVATVTGLSPLLTVSGNGCIFKNLYIFSGCADATNLINVKVTGVRNYFENVHFAGGGNATQAVNGGASLNLGAPATENRFVDCTIGVDTIAAATGMVGLLFNGGTSSLHTTRNIFENCRFTMKAGSSGAAFVEMMTIYDIDRYTTFENCKFINLASTAMASAFVMPAGIDPNDKRLLMFGCRSIGATTWDANDRGMLYGDMAAVVPVDLSGSLLEMIT